MRILNMFLVLLAMLFLAMPAWASPFDELNGRWTGWGMLHTANGMSERLQCITTYRTTNEGEQTEQRFRCVGSGYRFSTVIDYVAAGKELSGTWLEQIYSFDGDLKGSIRPGHIQMTMRAQTFDAAVSIISSRCAQNIDIQLRGSIDIDRISLNLKRC